MSLPLFTEHACVVVPVGHPLFEKESLTLKDLNGETLIFSRGNEAEAAKTTRGYKRLGVSIKTVFAESWMIHANASHTTKYLIGASNISLKYLPSNPSSRVLPIIDDIPNLTTYHFYFVFSKTCRSMGELYLKLKALL